MVVGQTPTLFLNNVVSAAPIYKNRGALPKAQPFEVWYEQAIERGSEKRKTLNIDPSKHEVDYVLASLEDHSLEYRPFSPPPCPVTTIIIVRSPDNLFASRIRRAAKNIFDDQSGE